MQRSRLVRAVLVAVAVALLFVLVSSIFVQPVEEPPPINSITTLVARIEEGRVVSLFIGLDYVDVEVLGEGEGRWFYTLPLVYGTDLVATLKNLGVTEEDLRVVDISYSKPPPEWLGYLWLLVPAGLLVLGLALVVRRASSGEGGLPLGPLGRFGSSQARRVTPGDGAPKVTFEDVAGADEAEEELQEVVAFLSCPERYEALGARVPSGVLLVGPPGTGKTLLARAVAGEAGVPFYSISGSEFMEMFVGVGASRVRDLFDRAKEDAPSIVFIDDIDAMGGRRGLAQLSGDREYTQTLTQILNEMDGFEVGTNVVVFAATNRPDILDPALLRPGRFDRRVVVDRPDLRGREAILRIHVRGKPIADDVDLHDIASRTPGFVGADLENLANEAAILAVRRGCKTISPSEFRDAVERVIAGPERKSRLISEEERRIIAYHEGGHALVMHTLPHCDPVRKVSTISRGSALGYTIATPESDSWLVTKVELLDDLAGILGGRAAEELAFGTEKITSGAANDLEKATETARRMVTRFGMSESFGLLSLTAAQEDYLRQGLFQELGFSPQTAREVEEETRGILDGAYERAKEILQEKQGVLEVLVAVLLKEETIDREGFLAIVEGESPDA
jgi:cell division protease FtsH